MQLKHQLGTLFIIIWDFTDWNIPEYSKDFFVNLISFGVVNTFVGFVSNEACASGKKKTCCVLRPGPTKTMTEIVSLLKYSERTDGTDAPQKKN